MPVTPSPSPRAAAGPDRPVPRDAGMTLVEVVVALGLFAVMSTAVLVVLGSALTTTTDDKARLAAGNLASRELAIVRDTFSSVTRGPDRVVENTVVNANPLPGGTAGEPLVVDGVPYTVTRTAQWDEVGSAKVSPCDAGTSDELAYLRVEVQVRWPALGDRPPVSMETVMTPPKGTYTTAQGHIGLLVLDSAGAPLGGVPVTATKGALVRNGTTSPEGCVLLSHLEPGDWRLTASRPDHVDPQGGATATTVARVQANRLWRGTVDYDRAATVVATMTAPAGHALPPLGQVPVTVAHSAIQPIGARVVPVATTGSGSARVVSGLWPYLSGYEIWAGGCLDGNPALSGTSAPVAVTPGASAVATLPLGGLEVRAPAGRAVRATHAPDALCPQGVTLELGTTGADGALRTSLPYGRWSVNGTDLAVVQGDPQVVTP